MIAKSSSSSCATCGRRARSSGPSALPYTAVSGASASSSIRISGLPTSPAWRMQSTSLNTSTTSGRSKPWVSDRMPRRTLLRLPSFDQCDLHAHVIEHALHDEVDQITYLLGLVVEPRRRGQHDRPGFGGQREVAEVDERERRLAGDEHQRPPLLERHVGSALDERAAR